MIDYEDNLWSMLRLDGSVMPGALMMSMGSTAFAVVLCAFSDSWPDDWVNLNIVGLTWSAMTACIGMLIGLRIKQALGRFWEGTSLLHQMRGEWFDAASCLITFSRDAKLNKSKGDEVAEFQGALLRLMSLMHGTALDEISDSGTSYDVIDINGLDATTLIFLRDCKDKHNCSKVEALPHLIQVLVTENHHTGVLTIPPPILSRVYQTLSRGLVNLMNARKIKDTMFPFPFVQTIKFLLLIHSIVTPAIMTTVLKSSYWAVLFTFVPLFGLHCLNITAWQLEMPFGADSNDLPLAQFQEEMNDCLVMLVSEGADRCPRTSKSALSIQAICGEQEIFIDEDSCIGREETLSFTPEESSPGEGHGRRFSVALAGMLHRNSGVQEQQKQKRQYATGNTKSMFNKEVFDMQRGKAMNFAGSGSGENLSSNGHMRSQCSQVSGSVERSVERSGGRSVDKCREKSQESCVLEARSKDAAVANGRGQSHNSDSPRIVKVFDSFDPDTFSPALAREVSPKHGSPQLGHLIRLGEIGIDKYPFDLNGHAPLQISKGSSPRQISKASSNLSSNLMKSTSNERLGVESVLHDVASRKGSSSTASERLVAELNNHIPRKRASPRTSERLAEDLNSHLPLNRENNSRLPVDVRSQEQLKASPRTSLKDKSQFAAILRSIATEES